MVLKHGTSENCGSIPLFRDIMRGKVEMVRVRSVEEGWQIAKDCSFWSTVYSQTKKWSSSVGAGEAKSANQD